MAFHFAIVIFIALISAVMAVDYVYQLDCSGGQCGSGGDYSVRQTSPTPSGYSFDPALTCSLGDTITLVITTTADLRAHPIAFVTGSVSTTAPYYVGTTTNSPMAPGDPVPANCTITCDAALVAAQALRVYYVCYIHEQMGGAILITTPPTPAPTAAPTPTPAPTPAPTPLPTPAPTLAPTPAPTRAPTEMPTQFPTAEGATFAPTVAPTEEPTAQPTAQPTEHPTVATLAPTPAPSDAPTSLAPTTLPPPTEALPTVEPVPTTAVIPTAPVAPIAPGRFYRWKCDLDNGMTFKWNPVNNITGQLDFAVSAPTLGWVGVAFNDKFLMIGGDALIGWVKADGTSNAFSSYLTSRAPDASGLGGNPSFGSFTYAGAEINGVTTMEYSRNVQTGYHPIPLAKRKRATGPNSIVVYGAYSDVDGPVSAPHVGFPSYGQLIDLTTGSASPQKTEITTLRIVHAVVCSTAFGLLFPLGILFARYGKRWRMEVFGTKVWFICHMSLQVITFIIALGGIIIGFLLPLDIAEQMNTLYHGQLGCGILFLIIVQVILGFVRPHVDVEAEKKSTLRQVWEQCHHWIGRLIALCSIPQIVGGILEISYDYWPLAIYLPCTIVFLLIVIGLEIHRVMTYSKDLERV